MAAGSSSGTTRRLMLLLVLAALHIAETSADVTDNRKLLFRRLAQCPRKNKLSMMWKNVRMATDDDGILRMFATMLIREDISPALCILTTASRCDPSNPVSCEFLLRDHNATRVCELLPRTGEAWTEWINALKMPHKCPIRVGNYSLENAPLDTSFLKWLPVDDAWYKLKFVGYDGGKMIGCVLVEFQLTTSLTNPFTFQGK